MGDTPDTGSVGYANLMTARMKPTSATRLGCCSRTTSLALPGCCLKCSVAKDGASCCCSPLPAVRDSACFSGCRARGL